MPRTTKAKNDRSNRRSLMVEKEDHALLREIAEAEGIAVGDATRRAIRMLYVDHRRRYPARELDQLEPALHGENGPDSPDAT